eukprot:g3334.t1
MTRSTCPRCCRPLVTCFCSGLPDHVVLPNIKIIILQCKKEFRNTSLNSCTVARAVLSPSCLHILVGPNFENGKFGILDSILDSEVPPLLFFPGEAAVPLQSLSVPSNTRKSENRNLPPRTLILIDATWRGAKKIIKQNPHILEKSQLVSFSEKANESMYGNLRREPKKGYISTIECIIKALAVFEKENTKQVRKIMTEKFKTLVEIQKKYVKRGRALRGENLYIEKMRRMKIHDEVDREKRKNKRL